MQIQIQIETEQEIFLPCHCEERRAALCTLPGCILERCSMSRCCKPGSDLKKKVLILFKENNAFCTLPGWPGVANLIITSLLVRDWFRTRKRQILGFETKNRSSSKEHTHVFNRLYSKDKECSPLSCWWSAGTVQGIAHGLFGCDLRHRHQHIIIITIIIVIIIITSLLLNYISL